MLEETRRPDCLVGPATGSHGHKAGADLRPQFKPHHDALTPVFQFLLLSIGIIFVIHVFSCFRLYLIWGSDICLLREKAKWH